MICLRNLETGVFLFDSSLKSLIIIEDIKLCTHQRSCISRKSRLTELCKSVYLSVKASISLFHHGNSCELYTLGVYTKVCIGSAWLNLGCRTMPAEVCEAETRLNQSASSCSTNIDHSTASRDITYKDAR